MTCARDEARSIHSSRMLGPVEPTASAPRCTAVRDLFAGTPAAGSVVLTCGKEHHMDLHAHRMNHPDGSVTTWRN